MSLTINSNSGSAYSTYQLQKSQKNLSESITRLSSGKKINKAADDSSGMSIANTLLSQSNGYGQAMRNANDAISIANVADGALGQAVQIVQDIRVKALQAANATQSPESRIAIQADISSRLEALSDIADNTSFNGQKLLSGAFTDKAFQVGATSGETISISLNSINPSKISDTGSGTLADIDVTTGQGAQMAIQAADEALKYLQQQQSDVGSVMNQLESTINNLSNSQISTLSSASEIEDLDFSDEAQNLDKIKLLTKVQAFSQKQARTDGKNLMDLFK